mgnify:CR=1 FL=1
MASLSLVNVCKTYKNGFEAVKDVNLDIRDKEFLILTVGVREVDDAPYDRRAGGHFLRSALD